MVTDNERREVAKALREANFYMSYRSKRDMWDELRRIIGEYNDRPFGGVYTFARLADLIDPDCRNESFCKVCGHVIPDGWGECPRCKSEALGVEK